MAAEVCGWRRWGERGVRWLTPPTAARYAEGGNVLVKERDMSAGLHPFVNEADGGGRREGEGGAPPLGDAVTDAPPGGVRSGAPRRAHSMSAGEQREPRCMSAGLHPLAAPLGPMCAWHASLGAPASAALHPLPAASLPKPACGMCGMCDMCDMYGGERGGERPGGGEAAGGAGGGGGNAADMNGGRSASCGARMQRRPATAPRTAAGTAAGTEAGAKVSEVSEGGGGCSGCEDEATARG